MIQLKTTDEILRIRDAGIILSEVFDVLRQLLAPGVTTEELDKAARDYVESKGAKPAFLGYLNYPASLCVSINNQVIHGIPGKTRIQDGDIVSLDFGVNLNGYFSDCAISVGVGKLSKRKKKLIEVTEECLEHGIRNACSGNRVGDVSRSIFEHAKENGYDVVRQYCGHGVGFAQHEEPQVPNYIFTGPNPKLRPGMVIAIEPMINEGTGDVDVLADGWTVVTADGKNSAHAEHTIAVLDDRIVILTSGDGNI